MLQALKLLKLFKAWKERAKNPQPNSRSVDNFQISSDHSLPFKARGYQIVSVVKEVGSGVNDNRKKFLKLLTDDSWGTLVVEHKDRCTRFGFNYIETLLNQNGREIEVVNTAEDEKSDLMQDLIAIIYSFSARMYGMRRSKRKTEKIIEILETESTHND